MMTSHNKHLAILLSFAIFTLTSIFPNDDQNDIVVNASTDENGTESTNGTGGGRGSSVRGNRLRCQCRNGGVCIHRHLFCDCPVNYRGRFCEHWSGNHSCGSLNHADTFLDFSGSCRYCQCFNGTLNCDDTYTCKDLRDLQFLVDTTWNAANYQNLVRCNFLSFAIVFAPILHKVIFST